MTEDIRRVVIADDQELVRAGFRAILEVAGGIEVVGEAETGEQAVDVVRRTRPDVALIDIQMPRLDGLEATRQIMRLPDPPRVIVVTTFDLDEHVLAAMRLGASGFLVKDTPRDQLVTAVRTVAAGDAMLSPSVTRRLLERLPASVTSEPAGAADLSAREREVWGLVARGLSNAEIGAELFISEATVKSHVAKVLLKLGLRDRAQAIIAAYDSGLVVPGSS